MNYVNYDTVIVEQYKIKLVGWTYSEFINPSKISRIDDVRKLRNALKSGACHWIRLSVRQHQEHVSHLEAQRKAGQTVGKPWKKRKAPNRSAHKNIDPEDENENRDSSGKEDGDSEGASERDDDPPPKKARTNTKKASKKAAAAPKKITQSKKAKAQNHKQKSAEFITDSEDDDNGGDPIAPAGQQPSLTATLSSRTEVSANAVPNMQATLAAEELASPKPVAAAADVSITAASTMHTTSCTLPLHTPPSFDFNLDLYNDTHDPLFDTTPSIDAPFSLGPFSGPSFTTPANPVAAAPNPYHPFGSRMFADHAFPVDAFTPASVARYPSLNINGFNFPSDYQGGV